MLSSTVAPYFLMPRPYCLDDFFWQSQEKAAAFSGVICYRTSQDRVMEREQEARYESTRQPTMQNGFKEPNPLRFFQPHLAPITHAHG